jgi:hypothetical protein
MSMGQKLFGIWRENRITIVIIAALVTGYIFLRTSPSEIGSVAEFQDRLRQGQPTVVYFYSNT